MQLSPTKTEMILFKGILDVRRPPTIKVGGLSLRFSERVQYLGVCFGLRLSVGPHVSFVCTKSKQLFYNFSQIAKANWGIRCNELISLYMGLFIPIITYAAAGWVDRLNAQLKKKLLAIQRQILISVNKAYRTISADALNVIVGSPPINLLLSERMAIYNLRKGRQVDHGEFSFTSIDINNCKLESDTYKDALNQIKQQTILIWQSRWNNSTKGRLTFEFYLISRADYLLVGSS